ncbi:MAG: aldo/keto reductase [Sphaerochaeta sp.]|jgi:alcohol dehydrogenase (NADP+)|nr:aldo/keto reductase [Sphaerochaeta sp.]
MHTTRFPIAATGATIPAIGMGTFGSDHIDHEVMAQAVRTALKIGYRNIDCASVYGNEKEIGAVLGASGIARSELWITSKVWNDSHGKANVIKSAKQSLVDLGLEYLDLYLVHWPFPNYHPPHCSVDSRSPDARPFILDQFMDTWAGMEALVKEGVVRHIGTSNMTEAKLKLVLPECTIRPLFNEMELHPTFQQRDFVSYIKGEGIMPIGFSPLGSPNRPERDKTEEDLVDMEHPIVVQIAKRHNVHPATICLKWAHQNGIIPIPLSTKERNLRSNFEAIQSDPLTDGELTLLRDVESNNRLIKGQVFLWEGATGWQDLWDEDGIIAR